jgi:hypothetical protein
MFDSFPCRVTLRCAYWSRVLSASERRRTIPCLYRVYVVVRDKDASTCSRSRVYRHTSIRTVGSRGHRRWLRKWSAGKKRMEPRTSWTMNSWHTASYGESMTTHRSRCSPCSVCICTVRMDVARAPGVASLGAVSYASYDGRSSQADHMSTSDRITMSYVKRGVHVHLYVTSHANRHTHR